MVYGKAGCISTLAGTVQRIRYGRVPQYFGRYSTAYTVQQGTSVLRQVLYIIYGTAGYHSTSAGNIHLQCKRYVRVPQYFGRYCTVYSVQQGTTVLQQVLYTYSVCSTGGYHRFFNYLIFIFITF